MLIVCMNACLKNGLTGSFLGGGFGRGGTGMAQPEIRTMGLLGLGPGFAGGLGLGLDFVTFLGGGRDIR